MSMFLFRAIVIFHAMYVPSVIPNEKYICQSWQFESLSIWKILGTKQWLVGLCNTISFLLTTEESIIDEKLCTGKQNVTAFSYRIIKWKIMSGAELKLSVGEGTIFKKSTFSSRVVMPAQAGIHPSHCSKLVNGYPPARVWQQNFCPLLSFR